MSDDATLQSGIACGIACEPAPLAAQDASYDDTTLKLHVTGVDKYYVGKKLLKEFVKKGITTIKHVQKPPRALWAVLAFSSVADRDAAIPLINTMESRFGGQLHAVVHNPLKKEEDSSRGQKRERAGVDGEDSDGDVACSDDISAKREKGATGDDGTVAAVAKDIRDIVVPLHKTPYPEQLAQKEAAMTRDCVLKAARKIRTTYKKRQQFFRQQKQDHKSRAELPAWLANQSKEVGPIEVAPIRSSPAIEGYRNKCDFTIGHDEEGKTAVGFVLGRDKRDGSTVVARSSDCPHVPAKMHELCLALETFLEASPLEPYKPADHSGVWRSMVVRHSERLQQTMVVVVVNTANCSNLKPQAADSLQASGCGNVEEAKASHEASPPPSLGLALAIKKKSKTLADGGEGQAAGAVCGVWEAEKKRLLSTLLGVAPLCTSLHVQVYNGVSTPGADDPVEHVGGTPFVEEELFGLRFAITPGAFFQTNTQACEVLYRTVLELALECPAASEGTGGAGAGKGVASGGGVTLLDVCCGTGTIGICAAAAAGHRLSPSEASSSSSFSSSSSSSTTPSFTKKLTEVIGVEMCATAVECAKKNASANGVGDMCTFVCSRAELVLQSLLQRSEWKRRQGGGGGGSGTSDEVVAVVDPPRMGLHRSCLEAIRNCGVIGRLIYVSCNPTGSLVNDMDVLCGPSSKSLPGAAFVPVLAVPIDLFPSTSHCEMVVMFERSKEPTAAASSPLPAVPSQDVPGPPQVPPAAPATAVTATITSAD